MKKTILLYGDSNFWGHDPESYACGRVERYEKERRVAGVLGRLMPDFDVVEEALCGRTTCLSEPTLPYRNGMDYFAACLDSHNPLDWVVIMLGTNDLQRFYTFTPAYSAISMENYVKTVRSVAYARQGEPNILLVSPPHIRSCVAQGEMGIFFDKSAPERSRQLAPLYAEVARRYGCRFLDAAQWVRAGEKDGLHLDRENAAKLAQAICDAITATPE